MEPTERELLDAHILRLGRLLCKCTDAIGLSEKGEGWDSGRPLQ